MCANSCQVTCGFGLASHSWNIGSFLIHPIIDYRQIFLGKPSRLIAMVIINPSLLPMMQMQSYITCTCKKTDHCHTPVYHNICKRAYQMRVQWAQTKSNQPKWLLGHYGFLVQLSWIHPYDLWINRTTLTHCLFFASLCFFLQGKLYAKNAVTVTVNWAGYALSPLLSPDILLIKLSH